MTAEGKWLVAVYPCGCAPYADFDPEGEKTKKDATKDAERIAKLAADGADLRRMSREEALSETTFMPMDGCPHTPKGWTR